VKWWANLKQHRLLYVAVMALLVLLLGGAIAIAGAAGLAWTSTEKFCISCHEMRDNVYKEYKGTVHDRNPFGVRAICSNCHVPHDVVPLLVRKMGATFEIWGHLTGVIDTREKFEKHRYELATRVWTRMVETDSLECRNCHVREAMVKDKQSEKAQNAHAKADREGKTCIECHFGIAHTEPEGELGPTEIKAALKKAGKM
jgi:cytochrome c-type protein NapC